MTAVRVARPPQALTDIDSLKAELEGARTERKHKEEYEARRHVCTRAAAAALRLTCAPRRAQVLRKQCLTYPSRADTLAAITAMKQDIAALEQESAATAATVEVRATAVAAALAHVLATPCDAPRQRRSRFCSCASSSSPRCSAASTTSAVRCKKMALRLPPPPPPRPRPCS